jgi:hypothetical protein
MDKERITDLSKDDIFQVMILQIASVQGSAIFICNATTQFQEREILTPLYFFVGEGPGAT